VSRRRLLLAAGLVIAAGAGTMWLALNRQLAAPPATDSAAVWRTAAEELRQVPGVTADGLVFHEDVSQRPARVAPSPALLVRTARLSLVPRDFDAARREMERIVTAAGGFTGRIMVSDPRSGARSLSATLRIPSEKFDATLVALKQLGQVTAESQDGEDVTQQSVDLDARLANARASETRLKDILNRRTGDLADVLAVEREIARVRGEIEQMEAERKSLDRRISYAVVSIEIHEERKAAMDLGPLPVPARLRNALVDGFSSAITSVLNATLVAARVGPVLMLWALVLAFPAWMLRRRYRQP
jgi:hypothetical protein